MIDLIIVFVSGVIVGAVAVIIFKMIAPPPRPSHTRHRKAALSTRRRREITADMINHIVSLHRSKALSYPQAVTRIRTLEVAEETAHRVLNDGRVKSTQP